MKTKLLIILFAACTTLNMKAPDAPTNPEGKIPTGTPSKSDPNKPPQSSFFSRITGKKTSSTGTSQLPSKNENEEEITLNDKDNLPVARPIHDNDDDEITKTQEITFVQAKPINDGVNKLKTSITKKAKPDIESVSQAQFDFAKNILTEVLTTQRPDLMMVSRDFKKAPKWKQSLYKKDFWSGDYYMKDTITSAQFKAMPKDMQDIFMNDGSDKYVLKIDEKGDVQGKSLKSYQSLNADYEAKQPDINEQNHRIKNLDNATINTMRATLRNIKKRETQAQNVNSTIIDKNTVAQDLIKSQLDNIFGVDALAVHVNVDINKPIEFQSRVKFSDEAQARFMKMITEHPTLFDSTKTEIQRLQAIAEISDAITNELFSSIGASIKTTLSDDGSETTSKISSNGMSLESTINNDGDKTASNFTVAGDDGKNIQFRTRIDPTTGIEKNIMIDADKNTKILTENQAEAMRRASWYYKLKVMILAPIKGGLYWSKHVALNIVGVNVSVPIQAGATALVAASAATMKYTSKDFDDDPVIMSAFTRPADIFLGERRGWMSAKPDQLFRSNSEEEFYSLVNTASYKAAQYTYKQLPESWIAKKLVSEKGLEEAKSTTNINKDNDLFN